jgi:hypothetical protein
MPTYALHGLTLRSELPLAEPEVATLETPRADAGLCEAAEVDVVRVRVGEPADVPAETPQGEVLAGLDVATARYAAVARGERVLVRFFGTAEFEVDVTSGDVTVTADPAASPDLVSVLLAGNVLALLLGLRGDHVLHATAVELGGKVVALAGGSGAGKSTLGALVCAGGAKLVGDDLLRISGNACFRGTSEIRLRPSASAITELFAPERRRATGDGRTAVRPEPSAHAMPRIDAIVFPHARRDGRPFGVTRLGERAALERLMLAPRVAGWRAAEPLRTQFRGAGELAERVPVFTADVPWGPPFAPDLAERLEAAL